MTTFLLIRHAASDALGKRLASRMAGVHLNEEGQAQAKRLTRQLVERPVRVIYSSPLERAQETASPLFEQLGVPLVLAEQLTDVDFGQWTGLSFQELAEDRQWQRFNSVRSCGRPPEGESISEVQMRITSYLDQLCLTHKDETVAMISHGDVIKAALCYYAGIPVDLMLRLEISPASVSELVLSDYQPRIVRINDTT